MVANKRKLSKAPAAGAGQPKRRKTQAVEKKRPVSVDALQWKTVDVPEMFDDAEGFFGLEEIEGVEIVREGDKVKFMAAAKDTKEPEEDDFSGFDDTPGDADQIDVASSNGSSKLRKKAQKKAEKAVPQSDDDDDADDDDDDGDDEPSTLETKGLTKGQKKAKRMAKKKMLEAKAKKAAKAKPAKPVPVSDDDSKDPEDAQETAPKQEAKKDIKKDQKKGPKKEQKKVTKPVEKEASVEIEDDEDSELETNVFTAVEDLPEPDEDLDMSAWVPLNLSPQLLSSIARLGFTKPTRIQASAIPEIMDGRDVIGKASTGSGKTLAFSIPVIESWLARMGTKPAAADGKKIPIALFLSPTRELAHQIADHIKELCAGLPTPPYICTVTGGLSEQKQQRQLARADIIIGTPGRMWEIMSAGSAILDSLRQISFLVVDEADRLLKDGHFKEAEEIIKALDRSAATEENEDKPEDRPRQTLVFSATFNRGLQQKLAGKSKWDLKGQGESMEYLLKKLNFREEKPQFIDANPISQMAENLKEGLITCGDMEKDLYLYATILLQPCHRTLVFTNSINSVRRLVPLLQMLNLPAYALHSGMMQKARMRSLERFKANPVTGQASANTTPGQNSTNTILIATDVAARGLDIPNVDLIIHYHVPRSADDYVHRSGRTARASAHGTSVLLCGPKEAISTQRLVAKVHAKKEAKVGLATKKNATGVRTIDIDRKLVARLRERVVLAKAITDATLAKEKGSKEDDWMKKAADELGVDYDSDELEKAGMWSGRGSGRKEQEKASRKLTKAEVASMKGALKEMLSRRINTGVSESYFGNMDVTDLLKGSQGDFLGKVDGLGLDD
ncbi:DEAD-domain-containing protein [Cercophora scortea]|uniref:ATP-dependent RNA helicase n=1 Tax=Cercophora scortea TaxID=314031 RepID=A0AAE0MII6_9PEZI|nr:DEAD-domain-containing protein [Cercophora scortea]